MLITASLVFFMNLGFALVESGFCRAKNTVNILSKNFIVFAISCLAFYVFGWGLMFGNGSGFIGLEGLFMLGGADNSPATGDAYTGAYTAIAWTGVPLNAKFFFQLVFAGTAATIVSGAVAERIKYLSFIVFSFLLVAFVYPITGHWIWGGGWLATAGFWDFAGSTVVHSVGGWAALAGILILGPRLGQVRPGRQGQRDSAAQLHLRRHRLLRAVARLVRVQPGIDDGGRRQRDRSHLHDDEYRGVHGDALGDGAELDVGRQARSRHVGQRRAWPASSRSRPRARIVTVQASLIIGLLAGILVVFAVKLLDTLKIDDPVGAVPVHLFNGVFGTHLRRPVRRGQDHRRRDRQRPVQRRRHDAADGAAQGHRRGRRPTRWWCRRSSGCSSSSPSACASARKRKKKASTSASTARRRTWDLRRRSPRSAREPGRLTVFLTWRRPRMAAADSTLELDRIDC